LHWVNNELSHGQTDIKSLEYVSVCMSISPKYKWNVNETIDI